MLHLQEIIPSLCSCTYRDRKASYTQGGPIVVGPGVSTYSLYAHYWVQEVSVTVEVAALRESGETRGRDEFVRGRFSGAQSRSHATTWDVESAFRPKVALGRSLPRVEEPPWALNL